MTSSGGVGITLCGVHIDSDLRILYRRHHEADSSPVVRFPFETAGVWAAPSIEKIGVLPLTGRAHTEGGRPEAFPHLLYGNTMADRAPAASSASIGEGIELKASNTGLFKCHRGSPLINVGFLLLWAHEKIAFSPLAPISAVPETA